jgi:hypothetical protein
MARVLLRNHCPLCFSDAQHGRPCYCDPHQPGRPPEPKAGQWKRPGATYVLPGEEPEPL